MSRTKPVSLTDTQLEMLKSITTRMMLTVDAFKKKGLNTTEASDATKAVSVHNAILKMSEMSDAATYKFTRKQIRFLTKYLLKTLTYITTKTIPEYEQRYNKTGDVKYKSQMESLQSKKDEVKKLIEALEAGL